VDILSRRAARDVDRLACDEYHIPSIVLMENAAFHLADIALTMAGASPRPRILIVCGPGNNGGDGFAVARHLHNSGAAVHIVLGAPEAAYAGDAAINLAVGRAMRIPITPSDPGDPARAVDLAERALTEPGGGRIDLVIDAILGTGLASEVRPPLAALIQAVNARAKQHTPILAVDIPSGLDADSGEARCVAVHATITVTFVGLKQGFTALSAQPYIGDVVIAGIGAPRELRERLGRPLADADFPARRAPAPESPGDPGAPARPGTE
jgi:NAD(P)H-hydrate epimerase